MPEQPQSTQCRYCNTEAFAPLYTNVPMCERHLEITIYAHRLTRRGEPVTAENIREYMQRVQAPVVIRPDDVPSLLKDIHPDEVQS